MRLAILSLALLLSSCTYTIKNVQTKHIVMFNSAGHLIDPTGNRDCNTDPETNLCNGRHLNTRPLPEIPDPFDDAYRLRVMAHMAEAPFQEDGKRRVLIFVHGGLNTQVAAVERASGLWTFVNEQKIYPIFINWQSSFVSSYWDHLMYIRQGQYWRPGGPFLSPLYLFSDAVRSIGHAPLTYFYEAKTLRDTWKPSPTVLEIEERLSAGSSGIAFRKGTDFRRWPTRALDAATFVLTLPAKAVTAPMIDGFGTGSWDTMMHRTQVLYDAEEDFSRTDPLLREASGGLAVFMRELDAFMRDHGGYQTWSITLVGHSMGTIILNRMVREHPNLPIDRVVYLAAACSLADYEASITPLLRRRPAARMNHVMLNRRAEVREKFSGVTKAHLLWDVVPRGSLLVWIDNLLSKPNAMMQRTAGRYSNFLRALHLTDPQLASRVTILSFDAGPSVASTQPQRHGDVPSIEFWRPECVEPRPDYPSDCYHLIRDVKKAAQAPTAKH